MALIDLSRRRFIRTFALGLVVCGMTSRAAEGTLAIAAASDLRFALDEIVTAFKTNHPDATIKVTYGSSGNFYAQLSQRAPFDIFFSADVSYPTKLIEGGFGVASSKFTYAVGRIVIWVPTNSAIDPVKLGIDSLQHPSVKKVAIANPAHAPYGRAAVAAMEKLGLYEVVKPKLVLGENIAQTMQFVETGGADIGIIALSLAVAPAARAKGQYWEIPLDAYPRVEQGGMITPWANDPALAQEFRTFVLGESGKTVLRRYGFSIPQP